MVLKFRLDDTPNVHILLVRFSYSLQEIHNFNICKYNISWNNNNLVQSYNCNERKKRDFPSIWTPESPVICSSACTTLIQ